MAKDKVKKDDPKDKKKASSSKDKGKEKKKEKKEDDNLDSDAEGSDADDRPSEGILEVHVIGARRLQARYKKTETSYPYCKLIWGEQEFSTEVIDEDLNPKWKTKFEFNLKGENLDVEEMMFEVYDSKTKLLLGECTVPVAGHRDTPISSAKEHWYPLGGGKSAPKRQEITTSQKTKKKLDKKTDKALKFTGDLCLKIGTQAKKEEEKKRVFAVSTAKAIQIEDYQGADIQEMNAEAEILAKESNEAAKRALAVAAQTRQIGADTLARLDAQGQKLQNANRDLDQIDADLREANRDLRSVHSVGGQMKNSMTKSKYEHVDRSKLTKEQRAELARMEMEEKKGKKGKKGKGEQKQSIEEILAAKKAEEEERRKKDSFQHLIESGQFDHLSAETQYNVRETEQTIDAIADTVSDLKGMAVQMSNTLDSHLELIDTMSTKTTQNNARIKKTRQKVQREF